MISGCGEVAWGEAGWGGIAAPPLAAKRIQSKLVSCMGEAGFQYPVFG